MFDSQKIDAYFEGKEKLVSRETKKVSVKFVWSRFIKLVFPCIAASLLGLMVVLPNIKKTADIKNDITLPRKNEMEQLHVEKVVLNSTDSKNRVSKVWSDSMDEVEAGSDEIKIASPHAEIPSDNGIIKLSSTVGFMNQKTKILRLDENVVAEDEKNNILQTPEAIYDFEKEYGYGDKEISATGEWGKLTAQGFDFDKNSKVLTLRGTTVVETKNGTLTSQEETKYFQAENKIVSIGKATAKKEKNTLHADKIINYISDSGKIELKKTEAFGNVEIFMEKAVVKGNRAEYDMNSGTAEILGNVVITTEKGTAKGDKAVYNAENNTIDLYGNVVLEQNGNSVRGNHVHTDIKTSKSTMVADKKQGQRIKGTFYTIRKAENGKKTD